MIIIENAKVEITHESSCILPFFNFVYFIFRLCRITFLSRKFSTDFFLIFRLKKIKNPKNRLKKNSIFQPIFGNRLWFRLWHSLVQECLQSVSNLSTSVRSSINNQVVIQMADLKWWYLSEFWEFLAKSKYRLEKSLWYIL